MKSDTPVVKDLVLVGGGHSHVAVLKNFGMKPLAGVRVTLITRDVHTPYSGMLPGYIAGHYAFDETHIDLRPLAQFAGARIYHDEAVGIDHVNKKVICRNRPPVAFDVLSVNVGSTPHMETPGAADNVTPVKPINNFVERWQGLFERMRERTDEIHIGGVGAGAGGVEVLLAIEHRLRQDFSAAGKASDHLRFHLFTDADDILVSHNASVRRRCNRVLPERGIEVHTGHKVVGVSDGAVECENGARFELDEILWVTPAGAAPWLRDATKLQLDERGFIEVKDTLETESHSGIFAAGDIAAVTGHPRPKAGVFAVRQGPPLAENLRRSLTGRRLKPFKPQSDFLSLVSTGDKYAIGSRNGWAVEGEWVWALKNWIDLRWMRKYQELPEMPEEEGVEIAAGLADAAAMKEISAIAMRCGGCGAKVGTDVLARALQQLEPVKRPDILIGLNEPDDAAVVEVPPGKVMVHTVDFFRAFVDDPYIFGQVAANHALGDIFAMGGEPQSALAIASVPFGPEAKVEETLFHMMSGAMKVLADAGASLVGGHTSEASELALGFSINGLADRDKILRKSGMTPGDKLILTKPLGTGTLFAADMRGDAKGRWIDDALASMVQSNRIGAEILFARGATACTDVTGFGLLGHLVEMARPSEVDVELDLEALPLLDGAIDCIRAGIFSSLQPQNVRLRRAIRNGENGARESERLPLIFDPQTAGGLLASVSAAEAEDCVDALRKAGYPTAAIVGRILPPSNHLEPITLI
ncbi:MAG: selenide, water dikinase SelD [Rickettsiales bacterium]